MACEWAPVYVVPVNEVPANGVYEREPCSGGSGLCLWEPLNRLSRW